MRCFIWRHVVWINKDRGATWLVAFPLKSFKWPPLKKKALHSKFCNVKMKMPLKGTFPPTYRSNDPVLTSQLPFKGIKVRGLFCWHSGHDSHLTGPSEPQSLPSSTPLSRKARKVNLAVCQVVCVGSPSPSSGNGFPENGLGEATKTAVLASVCTKKPPPPHLMPLNGNCDVSTGSNDL